MGTIPGETTALGSLMSKAATLPMANPYLRTSMKRSHVTVVCIPTVDVGHPKWSSHNPWWRSTAVITHILPTHKRKALAWQGCHIRNLDNLRSLLLRAHHTAASRTTSYYATLHANTLHYTTTEMYRGEEGTWVLQLFYEDLIQVIVHEYHPWHLKSPWLFRALFLLVVSSTPSCLEQVPPPLCSG